MNKYVIFAFLLSCLTSCLNRENDISEIDYYEKCIQIVLSEKEQNTKYFFSRELEYIDELQIEFLGIIKAGTQDVKVVNCIKYSGLYQDSKRAGSLIRLYNIENKYLGTYYEGGAHDVPTSIDNNKLIFDYKNTKSKCNSRTEISFEKGIPDELFVQCTDKGGNMFTFSQ